MAQVKLPAPLTTASWDKQKSALAKAAKPPATKLPDELKELAKLNGAVGWDEFDADNYDSEGEIAAVTGELDKAVGSSIKALLAQLQAVEKSATSFETEAKKDKTFPKEVLTAVAAIIKAAKEHRDDVNASVEAAKKSLKAKGDKIAAEQKKAGAGGPPPKLVAMAKSRLLSTIALMVKPGGAPKTVRFMIVQGKKTTALALAYAVGPAQEKLLKGLLPGEAPYKVLKDPKAQVVWENKSLTFVSDKLSGTLLKKIQLWLKKQFKLNLKMRVRKSNGQVEEGDAGEDIPDDLLKQAASAGSGLTTAEVSKRRADMADDIKKGLAGPAQAQIKSLYASITELIKAGKADEADEALDEMEALLHADDGGGNDVLDEEADETEAEETGSGKPARRAVQEDEADEVETEEKPGAAFTKRMAAMGAAIKAGLAGPEKARIKLGLEKITELTGKSKFADAGKVLDAIQALLGKGGGDAPTTTGDGGGKGAAAALDEWKTRRAAAVTSLKAVATQVANAKHASSAKAIIELQAVIKNLTEAPSTVQQVKDLERWLKDDDVVTDVCELAEDIRTPLLGALGKLRDAIAA
ncbi:hypothetical protein J2X20_005716 [Pelomonas saccharophila]|uniref:Uncharacterized protein n=1 Tax=Roseateles saccharophilus TaxID=304 RepID=A0ABU1YVY0_ROSSA|nr:hypothetical protein [Roseateles saccharophilus]MDR7273031.1 hypothetical protein [Roseateles saccharophilus]